MYKKTSLLDGFELPNITHENIKQQLIKLGNSHLVRQRKSIDGLPIEERLKVISDEVMKILSRYKDFVRVIYDENELNQYIDYVISRGEEGILAFDTETNNSLEPITCKLMGGCIYTPGQKNAYIPVNHIDASRQLLPNQLTETQIKEQFDRLHDTKIIMHNGKFDYEVIKCTCDCALDIYWDTLIAAKVLDENELAGLKEQYRMKIDAS